MTAIYHITSIKNLPGILRKGGLICDREMMESDREYVSIAHQHIKERRANKQVPCTPGGTVADYVPFYFAPRSPMLYVIYRGGVEGYRDGQTPILHLVSSAEVVKDAGLPFIFTDGHAEMRLSNFYQDLDDLNKVDWNVMRLRYWRDTNADNDRERRRQAEFLIHQFFPFNLVESIGVINSTIQKQVLGLLQNVEKKPDVRVMPSWYYL
jgi:hypothetical protein